MTIPSPSSLPHAPTQPIAWLVEFQEMIGQDVWVPVHVVYDEPQKHYAGCATPISSQLELNAALKRQALDHHKDLQVSTPWL